MMNEESCFTLFNLYFITFSRQVFVNIFDVFLNEIRKGLDYALTLFIPRNSLDLCFYFYFCNHKWTDKSGFSV